MSSRLKNCKATRKNRKYWKIEKILPPRNALTRQFSFKLHNEKWMFVSLFPFNGWFLPRVYYKRHGTLDQFKVRAGIVDKSGKEIITSNGKTKRIYPRPMMIFERLFHHSQLDSILKLKKTLKFFIEVKRKGETVGPKIQMDFKELLLSGENSDVTVLVKCKKFNCHSIILGARSPVLKAMMKQDRKENCITITDTDPTVFQEFLLYLYSGSEEHLNMDSSTELYKLGDKYLIDDLKDLCVKHMMINMSTENFFEIFLLSQQHNDTKLCKAAIQLLLKQSKKFVNSRKWKDFLWKYPDHTDVLIKTLDGVATVEQAAPSIRITRSQNLKEQNKHL